MLDNDEMNFQIRDYTRKHLVEESQVKVGEAVAAMYLRSGPNEIAACRTSAPLPTQPTHSVHRAAPPQIFPSPSITTKTKTKTTQH